MFQRCHSAINQISQSNGKDIAPKYLISMLDGEENLYVVLSDQHSLSSIKCA